MKALTLSQPYASLIALRAKCIETRSWQTHYRGEIAIHAAKGLTPVGGKDGFNTLVATEPFRSVLKKATLLYDEDAPYLIDVLPFGAIVATATLVNCVPTEKVRLDIFQHTPRDSGWTIETCKGEEGLVNARRYEYDFGDLSAGRYAWLLKNIKPLAHPVPCKGALSLWKPDETLMAQVRKELMP